MAKIMLVEDDKSLREIYSIRLVAEGYNIVLASDGEEALALAVKEKPDLIISDVMMPKISGFDMMDILRATPATKDIKVIIMTALSGEEQRQRSEALGAAMHLVKSQAGIEDIVGAVHRVLGDRPDDKSGAQNSSTQEDGQQKQVNFAETPVMPLKESGTASSTAPASTPSAPADSSAATDSNGTNTAAASADANSSQTTATDSMQSIEEQIRNSESISQVINAPVAESLIVPIPGGPDVPKIGVEKIESITVPDQNQDAGANLAAGSVAPAPTAAPQTTVSQSESQAPAVPAPQLVPEAQDESSQVAAAPENAAPQENATSSQNRMTVIQPIHDDIKNGGKSALADELEQSLAGIEEIKPINGTEIAKGPDTPAPAGTAPNVPNFSPLSSESDGTSPITPAMPFSPALPTVSDTDTNATPAADDTQAGTGVQSTESVDAASLNTTDFSNPNFS